MIYGTLLKIKDIPEDEFQFTPLEWTLNVMDVPPQELPIKVESLKTEKFNTNNDAIASLFKLKNSSWNQKYPGSLGIILHNKEAINSERIVSLLRLSESDTVSCVTIRNPLWRGKKPVMRKKQSVDFSLLATPAMHNQLYAMLDSGHDSKWMNSFKLDDNQAEPLYKWQRSNTKKQEKTNMSPEQMLRLTKNIINHTKLPQIALKFIEEGDSCFFSVSPKGAKAPEKNTTNMITGGMWDFLHTNEPIYDVIGRLDKSNRVVFSGMSITIVMAWGMNPLVLIHELAHYFTFCLATDYRLNRGDVRLSFKEYTEVFSGHGTLYMGVFARMLIQFGYIKESWLYDSWDQARLKYIFTENLTKEAIDEGITSLYSRK